MEKRPMLNLEDRIAFNALLRRAERTVGREVDKLKIFLTKKDFEKIKETHGAALAEYHVSALKHILKKKNVLNQLKRLDSTEDALKVIELATQVLTGNPREEYQGVIREIIDDRHYERVHAIRQPYSYQRLLSRAIGSFSRQLTERNNERYAMLERDIQSMLLD